MGEHRIIVIEDQEDLAVLYEASLTEAGYRVTNAYTGEEGVAEFRAEPADAILLDMTLPEMNGLQVLREIRSLSPNVPVIVVTGEANDETRRQCERLGVHEYLSKPPDYDALIGALGRALAEPEGEDYQVVTWRVPKRVVEFLTSIDPNLERAIERLCDECSARQKAEGGKQKAESGG
ncbi:MAG: response regulator [Pyrinomonadaceae bacterium]